MANTKEDTVGSRGPAAGGDASQLGLMEGMVIEELGWDEDVDDDLRQAIMEIIDGDLVEESEDGVDAVLLWLRSSDGDVMELLVDSLTDLGPGGYIWVLSPKVGRPGHVAQADLTEGAVAAGMSLTTSIIVSSDWAAHKVVRPKSPKR